MASELNNKKILVCGPSWVGDMVMSHSLVQVLQQRFSDYQIDMLAPVWSKPVARFMKEVSTVLSVPFKHGELSLRARRIFGQQLSAMHYERAYILPNSFKSALIPWFAGIPKRTGWKAEGRSILLTDARTLDKARFPLMYHRYAVLGSEKGQEIVKPPLPKLTYSHVESRSFANKNRLVDRQFIALAPGAQYGDSKQWPADSFVHLALELAQFDFTLVVVGSSSEATLCQQIVDAAKSKHPHISIYNFAGKITLDDLIHLLPICTGVVCHDSGLMHIAAALGVPLVAIYGSTSPEHTPPLSVNSTVVYKNLACSPCYQRKCPLGHHKCMTDITLQEVVGACEKLFTKNKIAGAT